MGSNPYGGSENSFSEYSILTWEHFSVIYTLSKSPIHLSFTAANYIA